MKTVVSKDGTKIAYDLYGDGPTLLYITGAICFRKFKPIVDDVAVFDKKFSVINYDRRGRGDSGDTLPYSIEKELDDIEALIDASGGKVMLYGHSSGAVLALEAGMRMPEKISKVIIYDASYVSSEKEEKDYSLLINKISSLIKEGNHSKAIKSFMVGIGMPKIFTYMLPLMPGWKTMKALAPTILYDMEITRNLAPSNRLATIAVPLSITYGEKSPESIKIVAFNLSKSIKEATLIEVKGQDHLIDAKILLPLLN